MPYEMGIDDVFIVTQGVHDDYIILGVFQHKKIAIEYAKEKACVLSHDTVRVEAWPLVTTEFVEHEEVVTKTTKLKEYKETIITAIPSHNRKDMK